VEIFFGAASVFFWTVFFCFAYGCFRASRRTFPPRRQSQPRRNESVMEYASRLAREEHAAATIRLEEELRQLRAEDELERTEVRRRLLVEYDARRNMEEYCFQLVQLTPRPMGEQKDAELEQAIEALQTLQYCSVCWTEKPRVNFTTLQPCQHSFCNECLHKHRWAKSEGRRDCCALCRTETEWDNCHAMDFTVRFRWHYPLP
jgi:hypothetical protein